MLTGPDFFIPQPRKPPTRAEDWQLVFWCAFCAAVLSLAAAVGVWMIGGAQ